MAVRRATHSKDWYSNSGEKLNQQLESWLGKAHLSHGPARAIIAPHAGYQYCGACSAFAYRQISAVVVQRIFILGPSHHVRIAGCALTTAAKYVTPLYDLTIDTQVNAELEATGHFERMAMSVDEAEHSIEMQLPYIAKVMEDYKDKLKIVPILVGSLSNDKQALYGRVLAPYLDNPQNLFVISSDFCHWGERFRYTHYEPSHGPIYKSIQNLDREAMDIIETLNPSAFAEYLRKTSNTICGRHPIAVLLQAVAHLRKERLANGQRMNLKFLEYAQSKQCVRMDDSSVSYASAALVCE